MRELLGERVRIRPWRRADTLMQERWPRYSEPFSSLWNIPRPYHSSYDDQFWTGATEAWAIELRSGNSSVGSRYARSTVSSNRHG